MSIRTHLEGTGTKTSTTLLEAVATGQNQSHCRQFVDRYAPMVRAIALTSKVSQYDTDDIVQEVMLAAVEALRKHRYDRTRGRFNAWLKGVIYHKILDARQQNARALPRAAGFTPRGFRAVAFMPPICRPDESGRSEGRGSEKNVFPRQSEMANRQSVALGEVRDPHPSPAEEFETTFEAQWQKVAFAEALDEVRREIDPATYQAFDLYARKNMPPGEVGKLLGLSRNAVYIAKTRVLARAKEKLAE